MTKIADVVAVATQKSNALQAEINAKTAEKGALDKLITDTQALAPETTTLFDSLAAELAQPPTA